MLVGNCWSSLGDGKTDRRVDTVPGLYTSRNLTGAEGAARLKEWQEEHTGES